MSCSKPGRSTLKVVIYSVSVFFFISAGYCFYRAFTGSFVQFFIAALWYILTGLLGIYGTKKESPLMLKAFSISVLVLSIFTALGGILNLFGVGDSSAKVGGNVGAVIIFLIILALVVTIEVFTVIYSYRLAKLIQEERSGNLNSGQPPPYPGAKSSQPIV